jgi:N-acetylneuraminate synthase
MTESPIRIIAEAGVNHDGDVERALALVRAAHAAGANAVKFQTFRADALAARGAGLARYQKERAVGAADQLAMLRALELDHDAFRRIARLCDEIGIQFLSTPFDAESLAFLADELDVAAIKISSGDLTHGPLLLAAARTGKPLILSTGMADMDEIAEALGVIAFAERADQGAPSRAAFAAAWADAPARRAAQARVTLLHCTSQYPAPARDANLRAMASLGERFGVAVGLSDHSEGIAVPIAAAALGARMIEKHLTLDRAAKGPDHKASLDPEQLTRMVQAVREVEVALGDGIKRPQESEADTRIVARRSLVAARAIRAGEPFSAGNMAAKRPATGRSPMAFWDLLGQCAPRDLAPDEAIP